MPVCKNCMRDFRVMAGQPGGLCRDCAVEQLRPDRQRTLEMMGSLPLTFEHVLPQSEVYTTSSQQHLIGDLFFTTNGLVFVHYLTLTIGGEGIQGGLTPYNTNQSEEKYIETQMTLLHGEDYGSSVEERFIKHGGMIFPRAHIQNISVDAANRALRITYEGADYWMLVKDAYGEQRFIDSWLAGASTVVFDVLGAHLAVPDPARLLYIVETGRYAPDFLPEQMDRVSGDELYYKQLHKQITSQNKPRQDKIMTALGALNLNFTAGWAEYLSGIAGREQRWVVIAGLIWGLSLLGVVIFASFSGGTDAGGLVCPGIGAILGAVLGLIAFPVIAGRYTRTKSWIKKLRGG